MRILLIPLMLALAAAATAATPERQAEVAERGRQVMPFDLDRTEHVFQPMADGGLQQVMARSADDAEQIRLIREHLREQAERFQRGDFDAPARIHGASMPGLAALRTGSANLQVAYSELPNGAAIRYRSGDPELVRALHQWFAAQLSDHGAHARPH